MIDFKLKNEIMETIKEVHIKTILLMTILCSLICLASCYPKFKNPIPVPSNVKADPNLLGTWVRTTKTGSEEMLSVFARKTGWMEAVYVYDINSDTSEDGLNVIVLEGFSASVSGKKIVCVRFRKKDLPYDTNEVSQYYLSGYEINKENKLVLKPFSIEKVEALINDGTLKGEIKQADLLHGLPYDDVAVTSSSQEILKVIEKVGVEFFAGKGEFDLLIFSRIK